MKYILIFLLFPCLVQAQENSPFGVNDSLKEKSLMKARMQLMADTTKSDTSAFSKEKFTEIVLKGIMQYYKTNTESPYFPTPQTKAHNPDSTVSIELVGMGNSTIEYVGSDSVPQPVDSAMLQWNRLVSIFCKKIADTTITLWDDNPRRPLWQNGEYAYSNESYYGNRLNGDYRVEYIPPVPKHIVYRFHRRKKVVPKKGITCGNSLSKHLQRKGTRINQQIAKSNP